MRVLRHIPTGELCDVVDREAKTVIAYFSDADAQLYLNTSLPTFKHNYEIISLPIGWFPEPSQVPALRDADIMGTIEENNDRMIGKHARSAQLRRASVGLTDAERIVAGLLDGCSSCPWIVGDIYQRDCAYPDCSPQRHTLRDPESFESGNAHEYFEGESDRPEYGPDSVHASRTNPHGYPPMRHEYSNES